MKKAIFIIFIFSIIYSCSKTESTPPDEFKLSGCDSIRFKLLEPTKLNSDRLACQADFIGQSFQGGIVAYFLQPGDEGYDAKIKHGLIVANTDQGNVPWGLGKWSIILGIGGKEIRATNPSIGSGLSNTNTIILGQGEPITSYAAGLARAYDGGGYKDWFLPSFYELWCLYQNRSELQLGRAGAYWSSTETIYPHESAWYTTLSTGNQAASFKASKKNVRAIRYF